MLRKLVVLVAFGAILVVLAAGPALGTGRTRAETTLLEVINATRRAYGLAPLHVDPRLVVAARSHTLDMLRREYFAHGDFARRMAAVHAVGPTVGENLAWDSGPPSARALVTAWLASPDHRANLLRPGFSRIGIGLVRGSFLGHPATTVVTTDFAGS